MRENPRELNPRELEELTMEELRTEYTMLFNGITETIKGLEGMIRRLQLLQQAAENTYLDHCEECGIPPRAEDTAILLEMEKLVRYE